MDSASGMLVIFFAVFVGAIASSFIIWLFVYRETGLFLFLLIISIMIQLILLCFSSSPFISVFFLTTYLCLHLNAIVALSHSLFHFFVCTFPPFLPPSLSLSFYNVFNFLYIYVPPLLLDISYCQAFPARSLCCVLCGRNRSTVQLDGIFGSRDSCKLHVATLATG